MGHVQPAWRQNIGFPALFAAKISRFHRSGQQPVMPRIKLAGHRTQITAIADQKDNGTFLRQGG